MKYIYLISVFLFIFFESNYSFGQGLPIRASRTIEFSTDEGSYMNVDISSNGKSLVFDLLGDLFCVPIRGGVAKQLTRGIALNVRPVWSPDHKRIAYVSDYSGDFHINVMNIGTSFHSILGGTNDAIDYGSDPVWLPDGKSLEVNGHVYGVAGNNEMPCLNIRNIIRFSSNGRFIYGIDSGRIFCFDAKSKLKRWTSRPLGDFQSGALSPDGRLWCCITESSDKRSLILYNLEGNSTKLLVRSMIKGDQRYKANVPPQHFSFSPDCKSVFIGYGGKLHQINVKTCVDRVIPFLANIKSDLGAFDYNTHKVLLDSFKVKYTTAANASPDGRHLVFVALSKIYLMDLPNGTPHVLVEQPFGQFQPIYSPDGKWIAYVSWCDSLGGSLWRVPSCGGKPEIISRTKGQFQRPSWNLDGSLIAIVAGDPKLGDRNSPGLGKLELMSSDGGSVRTVDDSVPLWNQISFSRDGGRIIYSPKETNLIDLNMDVQIVSRTLEGRDYKVEAIGPQFDLFQQKVISPDQKFVVYSVDEDLYLVPIRDSLKPWVISTQNKQHVAVKFAAGIDPHWEKNGKVLSWSYGNRFFRMDPNKIMDAEDLLSPEEKASVKEGGFISVKIKPDETIDLNVEAESSYAQGEILLRGARIITMTNGQVIENGAILIKDGRISAIGPVSEIEVPSEVKIINLEGTTIMPGLVDLHLHMHVPAYIFPQQSWMFLINLAYGVTTARDPSSTFDSFGYSELLNTGQMIGPRLYTVGRPVRFGDGILKMDSPEDARAVVESRRVLGATYVKDYLWVCPRIKRQWVLIASQDAGLNLTNEGFFLPIMQIGMIKDGSTGVEHNPIWGDVYKDVINFVAKSGVYFTPTLQVASGTEMARQYFKYSYWRKNDEKLKRFIGDDEESKETVSQGEPIDTLNPGFITPALIDGRIRRMGGHVTLGSHGNDQGIGVHNELWALQMGGLSNMEALEAATTMGAQALGIQKDVGALEVGKIADLLVLNGNPLLDIHYTRDIIFVMKCGILYDAKSLDEIWPIFKKCPKWTLANGTSPDN